MKNIDLNLLLPDEPEIPDDLKCPLCYSLIIDPVMTPCNHMFCENCLSRSMIFNPNCPMCRGALNLEGWACKSNEIAVNAWKQMVADGNVSDELILQREKEMKVEKKKNFVVHLEYGNSSEEMESQKSYRKKYKWKLFVRVPVRMRRKMPKLSDLVEEVRFNINPGFESWISCKKYPFEIERSGSTTDFEVTIQIKWKKCMKFRQQIDEISHVIRFGKTVTHNHLRDVPIRRAKALFPKLKMKRKKKK